MGIVTAWALPWHGAIASSGYGSSQLPLSRPIRGKPLRRGTSPQIKDGLVVMQHTNWDCLADGQLADWTSARLDEL
jgi:hypothetical protein